jgi:hypothetical protein
MKLTQRSGAALVYGRGTTRLWSPHPPFNRIDATSSPGRTHRPLQLESPLHALSPAAPTYGRAPSLTRRVRHLHPWLNGCVCACARSRDGINGMQRALGLSARFHASARTQSASVGTPGSVHAAWRVLRPRCPTLTVGSGFPGPLGGRPPPPPRATAAPYWWRGWTRAAARACRCRCRRP